MNRKYAHCNKLKRKIEELQNEIVQVCTTDVLQSQSGSSEGEVGVNVGEGPTMTTQQITAFADEDAGWTTNIEGAYDSTMNVANNGDSSLGAFLQRPIRAQEIQWAVGQPLFFKFNPWETFQQNAFVADKIGNYELIRHKLHMKILISGTQFHYGRAIASYNPLAGLDQVTVERNFLDIDVIAASQKPHFWINPTNNTGGELCMPYFFRDNYMSLSKNDAQFMGEINIKSLDTLRHANGGDDPVTLSIYLWAEDVVLTMPTSTTAPLVLKSQAGAINGGDEYGQGIISKPAAAVAKAAGALEVIPSIAPYARATSMFANGVSKMAQLFGYSRPAVLAEIKPFKPAPTGNLANVDAPDAVCKLTLDSKQELTIDPRTVGLSPEDQMSIKSIATRESYLTSFNWETIDSVDKLLWNSFCTPNLFGTNGTELHPTPMAMLAAAFATWQGSIKFRFQIVKSNFHKGRLLVRYDPRVPGAPVNYNTNYSRVIDIAEVDDFEIVVGWAQAKAFLSTGPQMSNTVTNFGTTRLTLDNNEQMNGVLEVNVLNSLVSPSTDSNIFVNVFVSMCDDCIFNVPSPDTMRNLHFFPEQTPTPQAHAQGQETGGILISQSGVMDTGETDKPTTTSTLQTIGSEAQAADHQMEVFYGDAPVSLRDLFKRYVKLRTVIPRPPGATDTYAFINLRDKAFPYYSGWDPNGVDTSEVDGTTQLNVVQTPMLNWFTPCYAAWRGSLRRKFVYHKDAPLIANPIISNYVFASGGGETRIEKPFSSSIDVIQKTMSRGYGQFSQIGCATTNLGVNDTIEVEFPFYQPRRLAPARLISANSIVSNTFQHSLATAREGEGANELAFTLAYDEYVSTGEDFTLFFFTGCPIVYNYSVTETS